MADETVTQMSAAGGNAQAGNAASLLGPELVPLVQKIAGTPVNISQPLSYIVALRYIDFGNYIGFDPTGATDQSAILNTAINDAITQNRQLRIPAGIYLLNNPVNLTPNPGDGIDMVGIGSPGLQQANNFSLARNGADVIFKANFNNRPAFYMNNARSFHLANFAILGLNTFNVFQEMNDVKTNYNIGGCRDSRYSPYSGLCIDATNSAIPADGGYPGMTYFGSVQDGSSNGLIENVSIYGFVVGFMLCPTGVGSQTDTLTFYRCSATQCDTAYAVGQGQSKNCNILFGNWGGCRVGFDGLTYGAQAGFPTPIYGVNLGYLMRIFNWNSQAGPFYMEKCYAESIRSLGNYGSGGSTNRGICCIRDIPFDIHTAQALMPPIVFETFGLAEIDSFTFNTDSGSVPSWNFANDVSNPIVIRNTTFKAGPVNGLPPAIGLMSTGPVVSLENCIGTGNFPYQPLSDSSSADVSTMAINNRWSGPVRAFRYANGTAEVFYVSPNNTSLLNAAATGTAFTNRAITFTANPANGATTGTLTSNWTDLSGWYTVIFNSGATRVALFKNGSTLVNWQNTALTAAETAATATANIVALTFTATDVTLFQNNDVILWKMLTVGGSGVQRTVPGWIVTGIAGSVVTCQPLFDTTFYDTVANNGGGTTLSIVQSQWAPTTPLTCTTNGTTALSAVSPGNLLKAGDWVQGTSQIVANSRVVSTDGAGNVVLNKAASGSASGVTLFFGRFDTPTVTPTW